MPRRARRCSRGVRALWPRRPFSTVKTDRPDRKRIVSTAEELVTYGPGRPRPRACARRPSGPQSSASAAWALQCSPGASQDAGFAARTGTQDEVVLPSCGERAEACLKEAGVTDVSFSTFAMAHATHPAQMKALKSWLEEKLRLV